MKTNHTLRTSLSRYLMLLALVLLMAGDAVAQSDWFQFRGPTGEGIAANVTLPTEWGPEKNIAWRQEVPGLGWSSPVVSGDRIFLTTAVPQSEDKKPDHSLRTLCLAADTGKILWDVEVFLQVGETAPKIHGKNSHASPTPYLEGEFVYVHYGHMGTACLRQKDGSVVWSTQELTYKPTHGNGGSPVIWGSNLIFSIDGSDMQAIIALDKTTGELAWKAERNVADIPKYFSFSTPLLIEVDGQTQLISAGSGTVMAVDPSDGREIWRVGYGNGYSVVPRPIYANGLVYVCTGYDKATLVAIRPDGKGDVTESNVAFIIDRNVPLNPSLVAVGTSVYMISDNGILSCLEGKTGEVLWKERVGGNFSSSLLYAGGLLYLLDEAGKSTIVKPGEQYEVVAENNLAERALSSLGVIGSDILLRTENALYRIAN